MSCDPTCDIKATVDIASTLLTMGVTIAGAAFAYYRFVKNRLFSPRMKLEIDVDSVQISSTSNLIEVRCRAHNTGTVRVDPKYARMEIREVALAASVADAWIQKRQDFLKPGEHYYSWEPIVNRQIDLEAISFHLEPGESDQLIADYLIDSKIPTIQVHVYIRNPEMSEDVGWAETLILSVENIMTDKKQTQVGDQQIEQKQQKPQQSKPPAQSPQKEDSGK